MTTHSRQPGLERIGAVLDRLWEEEPRNGIVGPIRSEDVIVDGIRPGKVLGIFVREGAGRTTQVPYSKPDGQRAIDHAYYINIEEATTWFFERLAEVGALTEHDICAEGGDVPLRLLAAKAA